MIILLLIILLSTICIVCRCVVFERQEIKWWKSFVPAYNKYLIGKIAGAKKVGIVSAIIIPFAKIFLVLCYLFEYYIIQNFATSVKVPYDNTVASQIQVVIPKDKAYLANIAIYSKYLLIVIYVVALIMWFILMRRYIKQQKKSTWLLVISVICPVIVFFYFAISKTFMVEDKEYTMKRVLT